MVLSVWKKTKKTTTLQRHQLNEGELVNIPIIKSWHFQHKVNQTAKILQQESVFHPEEKKIHLASTSHRHSLLKPIWACVVFLMAGKALCAGQWHASMNCIWQVRDVLPWLPRPPASARLRCHLVASTYIWQELWLRDGWERCLKYPPYRSLHNTTDRWN